MNKHEAQQLLPIIAAIAAGKPIQYNLRGQWVDVLNPAIHKKPPSFFRVKPEPEEVFVLYAGRKIVGIEGGLDGEHRAEEWVKGQPDKYSYKRFREVI